MTLPKSLLREMSMVDVLERSVERNRGIKKKAYWDCREKDVAASLSWQFCFYGGIIGAVVKCCYHGEVNISAKFFPSPSRCCMHRG